MRCRPSAGRTLPNGHLNRREQPRLGACRGGRTHALRGRWKEPQTPQHDGVDEVPTTASYPSVYRRGRGGRRVESSPETAEARQKRQRRLREAIARSDASFRVTRTLLSRPSLVNPCLQGVRGEFRSKLGAFSLYSYPSVFLLYSGCILLVF